MAHRLNVQATERSEEETSPPFHFGVLFIHGIGAQTRGQTLAEFGGPVYLWLKDRFQTLNLRWHEAIEATNGHAHLKQWRDRIEGWATDGFHGEDGASDDFAEPDLRLLTELAKKLNCETVGGRVFLTDALIKDPENPGAPAHAELRFQRKRINGDLEIERWLMAESWWAETFTPPRFAELARWGLRIIPWTIGSHFGAQVRRVLDLRPQTPENGNSWKQTGSWLIWVVHLLVPLLGLIAGLLVSPLLLGLLAILLLVWLLPIPQVREALLKLQLTIASTLGDSYVLVSRPVEAASIIDQVRRDIGWLASQCKAVVIVAHSQGGAVAHKALQRSVPPNLRLLFTFGSGLKKLEELTYLLSPGHSGLRTALITLVALFYFGLGLVWFGTKSSSDLLGQISFTLSMLGYLFVSGSVLVGGLLYYIKGIDLPNVRRWIKRLQKIRVDWVDCYATADPVSNGTLIDDPWVKELSKEVCNEGSILRDHNSYWTNRDQFVTLLIERLTQPKLRQSVGLQPAEDLAMDERYLNWIRERRRWRVGILSAIGLIGIVSIPLAIYQELQAWLNLFVYSTDHVAVWWTSLLGGEAKPANDFVVSWPALGYLTLVFVPYWITRWRWRVWNEREMRELIQVANPSLDISLGTFVGIQLLIAAGLLYGQFPAPIWLFVILLGPMCLVIDWMAPVAPDGSKHVITAELSPLDVIKRAKRSVSFDKAQPYIDYVQALLLEKLLPRLAVCLLIAVVCWYGFVAVVYFFGGSILGFRPSEASSLAVILITIIIFVIATGVVLIRLYFRQRAALSANVDETLTRQ